ALVRGPAHRWTAMLGLGLLLIPTAVRAEEEERFDHRGALGFLVGGGIDFKREVKTGGETEEGRGALVETLLSFPFGASGNGGAVRGGAGGAQARFRRGGRDALPPCRAAPARHAQGDGGPPPGVRHPVRAAPGVR